MITTEIVKNTILAGLPQEERDLILPACQAVDLHLGDSIDEAGKPIQFLYFPLNSAISVTSFQDLTHMVEVTITGKEGCSGSSVVQGDDRSMCSAMVQIPGTAVRIPPSTVVDQLPHLRYLGAALSRHTLLLMRNAVISVGCSAYHTVPQRLARWLKAHWHRTGIESFPFSVQFLSAQVGAEPHIVAKALDNFQSHGIVKSTHNTVTITDQDALGKQACACYELAKKSTDEYMAALTKIVRTHESH
jgi:CRP-like cAMP-binding protein